MLLDLLGGELCLQILVLQPLLHEGHELVCLHVFEASLCSLCQKPSENIFISVLFALLVSYIKGVAGLLVEGRERVGRMNECLFQLGNVLIRSLASDQGRSLRAWSLAREPRACRYFASSRGLALESDSAVQAALALVNGGTNLLELVQLLALFTLNILR